MINQTYPDLKSINETANFNVKFYAIVGAATSLAAELEQQLFITYLDASGLDPLEGSRIFYAKVQYARKRNLADAAVQKSLSAFGLALDWAGTLTELDDLCGNSTARNLIGHNRARLKTTVRMGAERAVEVELSNYVEQNEMMVATAMRTPQFETFESLFAYCERAMHLGDRLRFIGYQLRKARAPSG